MNLDHVEMPPALRRAIVKTKIFAADSEADPPPGGKEKDAKNPRLAVPTLLSLASGKHAFVFPFSEPNTAKLIAALLAQPELEAVIHNPLYDLLLWDASGVAPIADVKARIRDPMICQFLLDEEQPKGLKEMTQRHLRHRMTTFEEARSDNPDYRRKTELQERIALQRRRVEQFPRRRPWPTFDGDRELLAKDVRNWIALQKEERWPPSEIRTTADGKPRRVWTAEARQARAAFVAEQEAKLEEAFGPLTQLHFELWSEERVVEPAQAEIAELDRKLTERFREYARDDARWTLRLWMKTAALLRRAGAGPWLDLECAVRKITVETSARGIPIDVAELERLDAVLTPLIAQFRGQIAELTRGWTAPNGDPFNPNSDFHVRRFLFLERQVPIPRYVRDRRTNCWLPKLTDGGKAFVEQRRLSLDLDRPASIPDEIKTHFLTVDSETLERVDHPLGMALLNLSVVEKLHGTYISGNLALVRAHPEHRLRGTFNSVGTDTGRLSSSGPNLQNIPSRKKPEIYDPQIAGLGPQIRRAFAARPGHKLVIVDQSQIELRIIAHFTGDAAMREIYLEGVEIDGVYYYTGDIHARTSTQLAIQRKLAKCLDGSTYVVVEKLGVRRIGDLLGHLEPGDHRPIPKLRLADARGGWVSTTQGLRRERRPCVTIVTSRGVVTCTKDHRWLTTDGLKEAARLQPGDELPDAELPTPGDWSGTPRVVRINPFTGDVGSGPATLTLNEDWAYFAGLYQGDGALVNNHTMVIAHDYAEDWREEIRKAVTALDLPAVVDKARRNTRVGSHVVARYMKALELGAKKGRDIVVPGWVTDGGRSTVEAYLAGLFDTDGTVGESGVSWTTRCPIFAGQVSCLLRLLGMGVSILPSWNQTYRKHYYAVRLRNHTVARFAATVGARMRHAEKRARLTRFADVPRDTRDKPTIVKLVLDAGDRTVYDFHVDNADHLYLQGGFVGHNNVNFGFNYGMGPLKFARQIRLYRPGTKEYDLERAAQWREGFFGTYPGVRNYVESLTQQWEEGKTAFRMVSNRLRHFPEGLSITGGAILNAKVQGSSADIVKANMLVIDRHVRPLIPGLELLFQVHDELGYHVPTEHARTAAVLIKYVMERHWFPDVSLPILAGAKVCDDWEGKDDDAIPEIGRYYALVKGENDREEHRVFTEETWDDFLALDKAKKVLKKSAVAMLAPSDVAYARRYVPDPTDVPELAAYWRPVEPEPEAW